MISSPTNSFDETIIINNKRTDAFSDMMDGHGGELFRVDLLPQFPIRSSVSFCRHIQKVCAQILRAKRGRNTTGLVRLQCIEYELAEISVIFVGGQNVRSLS